MSRRQEVADLRPCWRRSAIIFSACAGAASPSPSSAARQRRRTERGRRRARPPRARRPYAGVSYPDTAIDCAKRPTGYTGEFSQIKAVDGLTVEFDLCAPDVSFLAKLAFASNGIQDSDWLDAHAADKSYVKTTNGTGPYMFKEWVQGDHITLEANPNYWGTKAIAQTLIFKWSDTAAQRLQELQAGTVDGIDNVGTRRLRTVQGDATLQLVNARCVQHAVPRLQRRTTRRGTTRRSARRSPWASTASGSSTTSTRPARSVADYFTPCASRRLRGRQVVRLRTSRRAKQMLKDGQLRLQQDLRLLLPPEGPAVRPEPARHRHRTSRPSSRNLGINLKITPGGQRRLPDRTRARASTRCSCSAGALTIPT